MPDLSPILARTRDDEIMKIIFGVGAVIVWGIFQMIAAVAKKAEDAKRRRQYGQFPEDVATRTRAGIPFPPPVPTQQRAKQPKPKAKRRATPVAPPVAVRQAAPPAAPPYAAAAVTPPTRAKSSAAAAAPANRIGRLLRQPASLRAAFILNEVLSQPVALRDSSQTRP